MYEEQIRAYMQNEIETLKRLDVQQIDAALQLVQETYETQNTIYICGNGGSSATASHFQNDFNKGISEYTKKKFCVSCLCDNVSTIMAIANDIDFEEVFRFPLRGRMRKGDILVAISGSGNSQNVLNAVQYTHDVGNQVIGMTGYDGGRLKGLSDISLHVPINSMQITEDLHMMFGHLMMAIFYRVLCDKEHIA